MKLEILFLFSLVLKQLVLVETLITTPLMETLFIIKVLLIFYYDVILI